MKFTTIALSALVLLGGGAQAQAQPNRSGGHWQPSKMLHFDRCYSPRISVKRPYYHGRPSVHDSNWFGGWNWYGNRRNSNWGSMRNQLERERRDLIGDLRDERRDYLDDMRDADNRREAWEARREYDRDVADAWDEYNRDVRETRQKYRR